MEELALYGGPKVKTTPFSTGKRFGEPELEQVRQALEQNTLFYWFGSKVKEFNKKFADMYGVPYCVAASSGTAAIHVALGACGVTEGDEVITSPITDMGSVIGILYQNAVPIFADVDPNTYNITPESIEERITDKTKAILVVHLAGNPADMDAIMEIAKKHNIKVIEDCAQAYLTYYKGRLCGTIGDVGCFSLNDFKHISAGDGGMLIMKDEELYKIAFRFADKNYNRMGKTTEEIRSIEHIAPNYRMSELVGAVGIAQLDRLDFICGTRNRWGEMLSDGIKDLPGVTPHLVREGNKSSYWFYMYRVDPKTLKVDLQTYVDALRAEGLPAQKGYIHAPVYAYGLFQNKTAYLGTHAPFDSHYYGREVSYPKGLCPVAEQVLDEAIKFTFTEFYSEQDMKDIIAIITKVTNYFTKG
ncbi:MAG: DegT/DnrJ/EryC1/StrS family aminotransferase [Ruminococcaceae bacterium]|nr:DegT/DnrJ/EryC1/StrS family aminotransferase [Oscillospiraceae bacterium]